MRVGEVIQLHNRANREKAINEWTRQGKAINAFADKKAELTWFEKKNHQHQIYWTRQENHVYLEPIAWPEASREVGRKIAARPLSWKVEIE